MRPKALARVVFPHPTGPTIATNSPGLITKLILFNIHSTYMLFIIIIGCLLFPSSWTYQADLLNATNNNNIEIKELIGNVIIQKDSTTLLTNRALLYSNSDQLQLFGNIQMIDSDKYEYNIRIIYKLFFITL